MSKKNGGGAQKLDLGIQAILDQAASAADSAKTEQPSQAPPTTIFTLEDSDGQFSPEYTNLAHTKQWGILVSKAESAISAGSDIEARLWWIRGHLGALSLPVSLLAAPFETVCRQLLSEPKLVEVYKPLVSEIGAIMRERLRGVGDRRQEHAVEFALQQFGLSDPAGGSRLSRSRVPSAAPRFELGAPNVTQPTAEQVPATTRPGRKASSVVLLILALIVLGVVAGVALQRYFVDSSVIVASESMVAIETAAAMRPPLVEPRGALSNLGALYYSLSESVTAVPVPKDRPEDVGQSQKVEQRQSPALEGARVAAVEKPAAGKEVVNTDGPIEGQEFRRGVERSSPQEARLPDPAAGLQPKPSLSPEYPEVGGVVLGEVKSVLVSTNVLDSPSFQARIIAKLREGDKVSVEARVGRWVRIRSKRGKTGYIFAQDVGEPEDFRSPGTP